MTESFPIQPTTSDAEIEPLQMAQRGIDDYLQRGVTLGSERDAVLKAVSDSLKAVLPTVPTVFESKLFEHRDIKQALDAMSITDLSPEERRFLERFDNLAQFSVKLRSKIGDVSANEELRQDLMQLIPLEKSEGKRRRDQERRKRKKAKS
jgi:hypothetical protein